LRGSTGSNCIWRGIFTVSFRINREENNGFFLTSGVRLQQNDHETVADKNGTATQAKMNPEIAELSSITNIIHIEVITVF
jgi:hypothetical protein